MLRKYIHHLVQDSHISVSSDASDHALEPDNFLHTTFHQYMSWKLNEITTSSPSPPPSVTASDPRAPAAYQHELSHDQHDNPYPQDYSSSGTTYGGIDMPAEEFYQVHTTNLNRPPSVSTITPRKPTSSPPPGGPTPRRIPGPIFLPANIYKLLSDVAIKEHKKHNATTRSTPPPKGLSIPMTQTLTPSINPLTLPKVIQPLQIPLQTLIWTILNPVKSSPLVTPPLSTSWTLIPPLTLSITPTSIMCLNTLLPIMVLLLIWEPMVVLLAQM